jgi:hypothetical protein
MVEATEELVRVYLEQNGYLVTASKKLMSKLLVMHQEQKLT